jgi:hypothetical protein
MELKDQFDQVIAGERLRVSKAQNFVLEDTVDMSLKGHIRVFEEGNPSNMLFEDKNVICLNTKYLFARLMADSAEPRFGIWGLALGAGAPDWPANNQPDALASQQSIITPLLRKKATARFVGLDLNTIPDNGFSNMVDFQTIVNATTDGLTTPIRELGLIGGGSATDSTNMATAPFFDTVDVNVVDSVILINYKTLPPLKLPEGINIIFSWILTF